MYMDGIKLFAQNKKELETFIQVVRIYSQDIGVEFSIEKCAMLIMRNRKRQKTEGIELPNQQNIRMLREMDSWKYLGILEKYIIKQEEIKKKNLKRRGKLLETKLYGKNLTKGINSWAVPLVRYSRLFLKWTREEL